MNDEYKHSLAEWHPCLSTDVFKLRSLSPVRDISTPPYAEKVLTLWNTGSWNALELMQHDETFLDEYVIGGSGGSTEKGGADVAVYPLGQQIQYTRLLSTAVAAAAVAVY